MKGAPQPAVTPLVAPTSLVVGDLCILDRPRTLVMQPGIGARSALDGDTAPVLEVLPRWMGLVYQGQQTNTEFHVFKPWHGRPIALHQNHLTFEPMAKSDSPAPKKRKVHAPYSACGNSLQPGQIYLPTASLHVDQLMSGERVVCLTSQVGALHMGMRDPRVGLRFIGMRTGQASMAYGGLFDAVFEDGDGVTLLGWSRGWFDFNMP